MFLPALLLCAATSAETGSALQRQRGPELEHFLESASVIDMTPIGVGISNPMKVTLSDGETTLHAVWKSIDERRHGVYRGRAGTFQQAFRDSYKYEIAAYELDKLLGLGMVPPTVERRVDGRVGSLQLWIEDAVTELDRRERGLTPPDSIAWSNQIYKWRLLQQLTYNDDAHNLRNVIYDPSFRVYAIDNSRSFRQFHALSDEAGLRRFSRSLLERLKRLERNEVEDALGRWLEGVEIDAVLARRDLLLDRARQLAAELGPENIFYP